MKSLFQNNLPNQSLGESVHSPTADSGIFNLGLGKKTSATKGDSSFQDVFMKAVASDKPVSQTKLTNAQPSVAAQPKLPTKLATSTDLPARANAARVERDLSEQKVRMPDRKPETSAAQASLPRANQQKNSDSLAPSHLPSADNPAINKSRQLDQTNATTTETGVAAVDGSPEVPVVAAAVAASSGTIQNELRPLKLAVGSKSAADTLVGNNAVLSFVTGRLDRLDPAGIPAVISESPFIKQAIASGDIENLMLQPMSVTELCKLFEIDQTVMTKAAANGLDPAARVTPKDFLTAIGIDPSRVSVEMTLLQQKLPIEGVKAYVDRARAMGGKAAAAGKGAVPQGVNPLGSDEFGMNTMMAEPSPKSGAGGESEVLAPNGMQIAAMPGVTTPTPAGKAASPTLDAKPQAGLRTVSTPPSLAARQHNESLAGSSDQLLENLLFGRVSGLDAASLATTATSEKPSIESLIDLRKDTLQVPADPFAALGLDMQAYQVETQAFVPTTVGASMISLEEQLAANGFTVSKDLAQNHAPLAQPNLSPEFLDLRLDPRGTLELSSDVPLTPEHSNNSLSQNLAPQIETGFAMPVVTSGSSSSLQGGDQFTGGEPRDGDQSGFDGLQPTSLGSQTSLKLTGATETFAAKLETSSTESKDNTSLHHKILQHATMMLKDGGGSMRMDVSTPGMGKIDLAINLANNQLDVRILTASDQARDIINKELSGLRDGLGQQGITLRTVEVGNASQGSQNFTGNFAQGRQGQQTSYNEMKEYAKSFADNLSPRQTSNPTQGVHELRRQLPSAWMNTARDTSRIAVRI